MNKAVSAGILILSLLLVPAVFAEEATLPTAPVPTQDEVLETLHQTWMKARIEYREALKSKKDDVAKEIKSLEGTVPGEKNQDVRQQMMEKIKALIKEHEEISDKIRVITAGDVVQLSNTKDKVVAFLTHQ